ncbi:DUF4238 domain-containing protein [Haloferax larsenii]|uniref:DUF4238 domain-containing protein n=1 Tax=Haloferax larsenii TaxID=302484 RepID=A0ABY5RE20_HALLR|nr:DUF4238 domain-containing protein [Haloferax larsenii]UVE50592.1 DUF4238 domain-containing protein [Haloferax larsenii]
MREEYIAQHLVHAYHLSMFSISEDTDHVHAFDKVSESTFKASVSNVAVADWYYDGKEEDPETELWLQKIESDVVGQTGAYNKFRILKDLSNTQITREDVCAMAKYIALHDERTATVRKSLKKIPEHILNAYDGNMTDDFREELERSMETDSLRDTHVNVMKSVVSSAQVLVDEFYWAILENDTDIPLWTSDNPVAKTNEYDLSPYGSLGLHSPGIQIYFPLSPDSVLALFDPDQYYLASSEITNPAEIKKLNRIQVECCDRQVYSSTCDFSDAKELISQYPEIADEDYTRQSFSTGLPDSL